MLLTGETSNRRKPCPNAILSTKNPTRTGVGQNQVFSIELPLVTCVLSFLHIQSDLVKMAAVGGIFSTYC
jgi:hypothetical protein